MTDAPVLMTVGELAQRLGAEQHQVAYAIRSRGIRPVARVGILRVFDEAAEREVKQVLARIRAKREGQS